MRKAGTAADWEMSGCARPWQRFHLRAGRCCAGATTEPRGGLETEGQEARANAETAASCRRCVKQHAVLLVRRVPLQLRGKASDVLLYALLQLFIKLSHFYLFIQYSNYEFSKIRAFLSSTATIIHGKVTRTTPISMLERT